MPPFHSAVPKIQWPELQIRWDIKYNSKIIFLISNKNVCCDPSFEPSR